MAPPLAAFPDSAPMMQDATVAVVCRFNRALIQRIRALRRAFPARSRPLGRARVAREFGDRSVDVRDLGARSGLDPGHLIRVLRALEDDGLVQVGTSSGRVERPPGRSSVPLGRLPRCPRLERIPAPGSIRCGSPATAAAARIGAVIGSRAG